MSDTFIIIQIILLMSIILGYSTYLYIQRRRVMANKEEEKSVIVSSFSGTMSAALAEKSVTKLKKRVQKAVEIINQSDEQMTYSIVLPSDVKLLETEKGLLIKGSVRSIAVVCYEFSNMEQLPEGFCVQLGDWKLFILEEKPQSSREDKIFIMPSDYWLFMSTKLTDSIYGEEMHPYNYIYEPFTFKKVLDYGIGVEATDWHDFNNIEDNPLWD